MSLLLENIKPSIGISTVDAVKCNNYRRLQFRKTANTHLPTHGEKQPESRADILQEIRESCPHLEENLRSETAICWKPRRLLDGDCQILLITDDPGMGKSTILTHLEILAPAYE
jgi:predicted ATP-dependent serine protease